MAKGTSRILLSLAVPSIFSLFTILIYKKIKFNSHRAEKKESTSAIIPSSSDLIKVDKNVCPVAETAKVAEMLIKENEANSDTKCNGVRALPKENCEGNVEMSQSQTNGHRIGSYAAAVRENNNINGSVSNLNQNCNGQVQSVETVESNNQNVLNSVISNQTVKLSEEVVSSASNNTNQTVKPKSKKRKSNSPEKNNTCSTDVTLNGCEKDNADCVNTLSNGVSELTVNENSSVQDKAHVTQAQEMSSSNCPTSSSTSPTPPSYTFTHARTFADAVQSSLNKNELQSDEVVVTEPAKESELANQPILEENNCSTSESEQSSETTETLLIDNRDLTFHEDLIEPGSQDNLSSPEATYCDSLNTESHRLELFEVMYKGHKSFFHVPRFCIYFLKNLRYICKWTHLQIPEEDSADSGRGTSELHFVSDTKPNSMVFEFEIPADHCGFLIGKKGSHVNYIKDKTTATIWIRNFPLCKEKKVVSVGGDENSIKEALKLIRKRFPITQYPEVSLEPASFNNIQILCPASLKLVLPEGEFQVVLSATVNAGHFFIQLPTHPSYFALPPFTMSMMSLYTHCRSPVLINPSVGNIVATPVNDGWFRAEIVEVFDDDTCTVKYLDYGGYQQVKTQTLRQMNVEFMQMPFQAIECYLANISCLEGIGWTEESKVAFERLAQGQILSAFVAGYAEDGVPCLHLYKVTGATNTYINQALVESGLAQWISHEQQQQQQ